MLCSPVGRFPHHYACLRGNEVEGSDWKKKIRIVTLRPWNRQHLVWLVQSCSRDQAGNQNVRQMFFNGLKFDNFCKFPCFILLRWASVCMDFSGSNGNGEYCAYNETTAPISPDCFICHHRYKQRPVSKPVKTNSFETGMPVYPPCLISDPQNVSILSIPPAWYQIPKMSLSYQSPLPDIRSPKCLYPINPPCLISDPQNVSVPSIPTAWYQIPKMSLFHQSPLPDIRSPKCLCSINPHCWYEIPKMSLFYQSPLLIWDPQNVSVPSIPAAWYQIPKMSLFHQSPLPDIRSQKCLCPINPCCLISDLQNVSILSIPAAWYQSQNVSVLSIPAAWYQIPKMSLFHQSPLPDIRSPKCLYPINPHCLISDSQNVFVLSMPAAWYQIRKMSLSHQSKLPDTRPHKWQKWQKLCPWNANPYEFTPEL